nr:zinc finger protein 215-like [Manis javanica]
MAAAGDPPEEQVTEHPVLEQFPNALPERARIWARSEEPSNSKEAGTRVANLPQTWGEKGLPAPDCVLGGARTAREHQKDTRASDDLPPAGFQVT